MIPAPVATAQRILAEPQGYGPETVRGAALVLREWRRADCPYCQGGIVSQSRVGRYPCQACEGTGSIWRKR